MPCPFAKCFTVLTTVHNDTLIDGDELVSLIVQHYEQFDAKYKGMMPLKRVYVPEPLEEAEG